jgi:hypothetical protein
MKWFNLPMGHVQYNKILAARTLFPEPYSTRLEGLVLTPHEKGEARDCDAARIMALTDAYIIEQEAAYNRAIFVPDRGIDWLCRKFNLTLP